MKSSFPVSTPELSVAASGFCARCQTVHSLDTGDSYPAALRLMQHLKSTKSINLFSSTSITEPAPHCSTTPLFGSGRGKMFGVLTGKTKTGEAKTLYAFSGQFNGHYVINGWAPPLFDMQEFTELTSGIESQIKVLGKEIENLPRMSASWLLLRRERRALSKKLMQDILALYRLHNFRGQTSSLFSAFYGTSGIPTGTGDCCAPKLLNLAACSGLQPTGLYEFYWGKENRSGTMHHAMQTQACREKCSPILGFLLCGLA